MKAFSVPNGIIHMAESKADCPHCTRHVGLEEAEDALQKSRNGFIEMKCKGCKREIGITSDIKGDIRSFELEE